MRMREFTVIISAIVALFVAANASEEQTGYDAAVLKKLEREVRIWAMLCPTTGVFNMPKFRGVDDPEKYVSLILGANHDDEDMQGYLTLACMKFNRY